MQSRDMERLPQLPGVTFHLGRGEKDAPGYVTLLHACQSIDGIDAFSTLEGLPTVEETTADFASLDPQQILVAEAGIDPKRWRLLRCGMLLPVDGYSHTPVTPSVSGR